MEDRQVGNGYLVSAYCRKLLYIYLVGVGGTACQHTQYYLLSSPGSKTMKQCIAVLFSSEGWRILSIFIVLPSCSMTDRGNTSSRLQLQGQSREKYVLSEILQNLLTRAAFIAVKTVIPIKHFLIKRSLIDLVWQLSH